MKLDVAVNEVVLSNVGTTGEFRIRNSAKAFKILSDGLYSNKKRAVIRELSCNALDSHTAAGKSAVPFEVHLPTMLEPWFSVQDFGIGLSGDQVTSIYTTYFESTKTESNDYIGALGLGSKSPFSYTDNFTITAVKDGYKRIYSAFINEAGVPSVAEMSVELTEDINGVEVKFSVTDRYDYESFLHEAQAVFKWFTVKPVITGASFTHTNPDYKEQSIVPGVHSLVTSYGNSSSIALMGNIPYPLNNISEPVKHFGELASLLQCGLLIEFGIGEVDFAASREELSYVPLTINSIRRKLSELNDNLATHIAKQADSIDCLWSRAEFLYEKSKSKLFSGAVIKYANDTKFPLIDPSSSYNIKTFDLPVNDLTKDSLSISGFTLRSGSFSGSITARDDYNTRTPVKVFSISVSTRAIIVLNDTKTGCLARAKYHYSSTHHSDATIFCISYIDKDTTGRQAAFDKLIATLHNPPTVVLASTLTKPPSKTPVALSNTGIMHLAKSNSTPSRYSWSPQPTTYIWHPYKGQIDNTTIYYYVCLNNVSSERPDGTSFDAQSVYKLMTACGHPAIADIQVMGVQKSRIKEIKALSNWVCLEDKLREETAKISDSVLTALIASDEASHYENAPYIKTEVVARLRADSEYAVYAKSCTTPKKSGTDATSLVTLCGNYGKVVHVDAIKQKLTTARQKLAAKYPLIAHASNAPASALASYIAMVDEATKP